MLSIEQPTEKRVLESGVGYSARKRTAGAGEKVREASTNFTVTGDDSRLRHSESLTVRDLNSDFGKERDDDWLPPEQEKRHPSTPINSEIPKKLEYMSKVLVPAVSRDESHKPETSPDHTVKREFTMAPSDSSLYDDKERLRSASPAVINETLRLKKLDEDGLVETPKVIVDCEEKEKAYKEREKEYKRKEKDCEEKRKQFLEAKQQYEAQMKVLSEQQRQEKGKSPDPDLHPNAAKKQHQRERSGEVTSNSTKSRKRFRSASMHDFAEPQMDQNTALETRRKSQTLKQTHMDSSSRRGKKNMLDRRLKDASQTVDKPSALDPLEKQEVDLARSYRKSCTCQMLPEYFIFNWNFIPGMASWPGGRLEFFEHLKQIATCAGHPHHVRQYCRRRVEQEEYADPVGGSSLDSALNSAQNVQPLVPTESEERVEPSVRRTSPDPPPPIQNFCDVGDIEQFNLVQEEHQSCGRGSHPNSGQDRSLVTPKAKTALDLVETERTMTTEFDQKAKLSDWHANSHLTPARPSPSKEIPTRVTPAVQGTTSLTAGSEAQDVGEVPRTIPEIFPKQPILSTSLSAYKHHVNRHQSMPPPRKNKTEIVSHAGSLPTPVRTLNELLSDPLPARALGAASDPLLSGVKALSDQMKELKMMLQQNAMRAPASQNSSALPTNPPLQPPLPPPISSAASAEQTVRPKKGKSWAEYMANKPNLNPKVPLHLRHSEDEIIEIGRERLPYERHRQAPEAFLRTGKLREKYKYLKTIRDANGNLRWYT